MIFYLWGERKPFHRLRARDGPGPEVLRAPQRLARSHASCCLASLRARMSSAKR